jgi:hypothetical protein
VDLRQQHRGFVCFGAAVGEKRFLQPSRRNLRELLRQPHLRLVGVKRRHVLHLVGLFVDRGSHLFVAMADADRKNPAEKVQILIAVGVVNVLILGVIDNQRLVIVGRHAREQVLLLLLDDFFLVHVFPVN